MSSGIYKIVCEPTANSRVYLGTEGQINLHIDAVTTSATVPGQYVYDLELMSGATVYRLLEGLFFVTGEVTK